MLKRSKKKKLGKTASHRKSMIISQTRSLFTHGYIVTTSVKAKVLKSNVEALLSRAAAQDELSRSKNLHEILASKVAIDRFNDYIKNNTPKVSLLKVGFRKGDNGEVSKISLVGFKQEDKKKADKPKDAKVKEVTVKKVKAEKSRATNQKDVAPNKVKSTVNVGQRARARSGL